MNPRVGLKNLKWFIENVGDNQNKLEVFVQGLLRQYQDAIDQLSKQSMFLGLWQVLENATLIEKFQKHDEVIKRVKNLLNIEDPLILHGLDLIKGARHDFVHEGYFPDSSLNIIYLLKWVASDVIIKIIHLFSSVDSLEELRELILLLGEQRTDKLRLKKKIIDILLDEEK